MSTLLKDLPDSDISIQEKVKLYNDCNRKVAILCNHKRTVGASHEAQMEKMGDRVGFTFLKLLLIMLTHRTDQGSQVPEMANQTNDPGC
jgi:DNA topoisomerase-1